MSGFDIILLILSIVIIAALVGLVMNYGQPSLGDFTEDLDQDFQEKPKEEVKPTKPSTRQVNEVVKEVVGVTEAKEAKPKKKKYYPKKKKQEGK